MSNRLESAPTTAVVTEALPPADPVPVQPEDAARPAVGAQHRAGRVWLAIVLAALLALGAIVGLVLSQGALPSLSSNTTPGPDQATPASPAQVAVAASGGGSILVTWVPRGGNAVGFRVYRAQDRDGPYVIIGEVSSPVIHSFADSPSLQAGATYWYRVTAFNRNGESRPSAASAVVAVLGAGRGQSSGNP